MWIRYEGNPQVRHVRLRSDEGSVLCDVSFDQDGRARVTKAEAAVLRERGYEIKRDVASKGEDEEE